MLGIENTWKDNSKRRYRMKDYKTEIQLFDLTEKFKTNLNEIQIKQLEEILELQEKKIRFEIVEEIEANK
jgi:hypothetical protein